MGLPKRAKLVIALYYYENLTLRGIGEVLGVTESRISQLHTKALQRLKDDLSAEDLNRRARHTLLRTLLHSSASTHRAMKSSLRLLSEGSGRRLG